MIQQQCYSHGLSSIFKFVDFPLGLPDYITPEKVRLPQTIQWV